MSSFSLTCSKQYLRSIHTGYVEAGKTIRFGDEHQHDSDELVQFIFQQLAAETRLSQCSRNLEGLNLTMTRPMTKLSDKRYGPFIIKKKVGPASYKLRLPTRWKRVHPVFNECLLTPFRPPEFPSQKAREPDLPPDIDDPDAEWDVKAILKAEIDAPTGRLMYLVEWDGFGPEENTWEYAEDLIKAADKIREFYRQHPGAPRPIADLRKKMRLRPLVNLTEPNVVKPHMAIGTLTLKKGVMSCPERFFVDPCEDPFADPC